MADLSELFNAISPDAPCGADLEYDAERISLDTEIQGTPEDQFSGQKYEPPNWRDVQKKAWKLLTRTKDLQVILYLQRALLALEGLTGFRDGLTLLYRSIDEHWDLIYPLLDPDDGDPLQRLNIMEGLCSRELVLNPLNLCILVESKSAGRFSLRDLHYATEKLATPAGVVKPDLGLIKAVFNEVDISRLQSSYQAVLQSEELLKQIEVTVGAKVSGLGNGVNLEAIKSLFKELRYCFEHYAGDRLSVNEAVVESPEGDNATEESAAPEIRGKSASKGVGEISSRKDVLKALELICKYYADYEPASPVPILVQRAKTLVEADFMEVVRNLMPDAIAQIEFLKGPEPGGE
jgi:type VI secretion system protein ImpA